MKPLTALINAFDQDQIKELERKGQYDVTLEGEVVTLTLEDVEISSEDIPGWLVASENGLTVALDITLTDDLRKEGISRDVVNRVQNLRKDKGLEVQDKISLKYFTSDDMAKSAILVHKNYIQKETQALSLEFQEKVSNADTLDIDGIELLISLEVVGNGK